MFPVLLAVVLAAPNIVVISADTLRADHLGCYGYPLATSPNIDALAAQSLVFEDVVCEVPLTAPSFCSMWTSRFPRLIGVTRNGMRLAEEVPLTAEVFDAAGYFTVCVQSNWTLKAKLSGLERGFDLYEDDFHQKRWGFIKAERTADEVTNTAIESLAKWDREQPLFAWIHYSDPHAPYKAHDEFDLHEDQPRDRSRGAKVRRGYDSEIAFMDAQIAALLAALPSEDTFIVFVADHGESLWDHGYLGHGRRIYQDNLHIPFLVHGPGIAPGRSSSPARGIDVGPTVLALAGLEPMPGALGVSLVNGPPASDRVRVIETYGGAVLKVPGVKEMMTDAGPQRQAVLLEGWKLILAGRDVELFHLPDDPAERTNLALEQPDRVRQLRALIEEWDRATASMTGQQAELNDADREALKSLGYIQ